MKVVTVIPITRYKEQQTLSYFSDDTVEVGMIVIAPIRKTDTRMLVIEAIPASTQKSALKRSAYQLKKIKKSAGYLPMYTTLLPVLHECATFYRISDSVLLRLFLPERIMESLQSLRQPLMLPKQSPLVEIYQASLAERILFYKIKIRTLIAEKKSLYIVVPTQSDALFFEKELSHGIEPHIIRLDSSLTKKQWQTELGKTIPGVPICAIVTPAFFSYPLDNVGLIIIESEGHSGYRSRDKAYDHRLIIETYARTFGIPLMYGDTFLRFETLIRLEQGHIAMIQPPSFTLPKNNHHIIPFVQKPKEKQFSLLMPEVRDMIRTATEKGISIFLFASRKGIAQTTVCRDCGTIVSCPTCVLPLTLSVTEKKERIFTCRHCNRLYDTLTTCVSCSSWHLLPLGSGSARIEEELQTLFPESAVYRLDKDSAPTEKKAQGIYDEWQGKRGSILVGTEYVFQYMRDQFSKTVIISFDSLTAIPSYTTNERVLRLLDIIGSASQELFIQTRHADDPIIASYETRSWLPLYAKEKELRKSFNLPPYGRIIVMTLTIPEKNEDGVIADLENAFTSWKPLVKKTKGPREGTTELTLVIRTAKEEWAISKHGNFEGNNDLREKIDSIPVLNTFRIDPDHLL